MNADDFAMVAHAAVGQVRKYTAEPYIVHPRRVANIIVEHALSYTPAMIKAALLHDVVEDTQVSLAMIDQHFGKDVAWLVQGMTKWQYPKGTSRETKFYAEVARLSRCCPQVKTIKLADSIDNMQDFIQNDPKYAAKVYIPEKRILIDRALRDGDKRLWDMADHIIREFQTFTHKEAA